MPDRREDAGAGHVPSGTQFVIASGATEAVLTEVGGGIRQLRVDGRPVVWGYAAESMATGGRGQLLAPWPNRLADGSYSFKGRHCRAPLDEPAKHNAIHGLVRWLLWRPREQAADRLVLGCELAPQPAYAWRLDLEVVYTVSPGELRVEVAVENRSSEPAPFGAGAHPYLAAGSSGADGCSLELPAGRRLLLDERGLPTGSEEVGGGPYDFRSGRPLAGVRLDDCFTALEGGGPPGAPAGAAWQARLTRGDGSVLSLWADGSFPYVMCFTGDTLPEAERRGGVAVEPMSCPPNALASGESLVVIEPAGRWSGRFGIRVG